MSLSLCYAIKLIQVELPQNQSTPQQDKDRKRKRAREPEELPIHILSKRPRTSTTHSAFGYTPDKLAADGVVDNKINPVAYWIQKERWPKEHFDQDEQTRKDFENELYHS